MKGFWILPILDFRFWMKGLVAPLFPVTFSPVTFSPITFSPITFSPITSISLKKSKSTGVF
jgi:hypothetical protein